MQGLLNRGISRRESHSHMKAFFNFCVNVVFMANVLEGHVTEHKKRGVIFLLGTATGAF